MGLLTLLLTIKTTMSSDDTGHTRAHLGCRFHSLMSSTRKRKNATVTAHPVARRRADNVPRELAEAKWNAPAVSSLLRYLATLHSHASQPRRLSQC